MLCDWFGWFCENSHHVAQSGNAAPEIDGHAFFLALTLAIGLLCIAKDRTIK
jgi:hypothetical protein